tara:strand:- start:27 stop:782 length:756 start_codon:yes stop_codon:yes gene_type:complete
MSITFKKTRERFKKLRDDRNQKNKISSDKAKVKTKTATTTKKKSGLSDFEKAFATARRNFIGKKIDPKTGKPAKATFMFKGKRYNVQTKEDRAKVISKVPSGVKRGSSTIKSTKAATVTTKPNTTTKAATATTTTKKDKPFRGTSIKKIGLEDARRIGLTGTKLRTGVADQKREIAARTKFDMDAKAAENEKLEQARRLLDPVFTIARPRNFLKTLTLDRLPFTRKLTGPPKKLPPPPNMAKGGSYFKGNF